MNHFDAFFRANYWGMVNYCASFGHKPEDAEEEVVDVIYRYYDEYREKIGEVPNRDATVRRWMNRRVLLNLADRYVKYARQKTENTFDGDPIEVLHFDDPESIVALKEVLPAVHPILINYEPYGGTVSAKGQNTSADKTKFCRERKKFLSALSV